MNTNTNTNTSTNINDVSDFARGYFEARGAIGHTYMTAKQPMNRPEWYERESEEYKRGYAQGYASLQVF